MFSLHYMVFTLQVYFWINQMKWKKIAGHIKLPQNNEFYYWKKKRIACCWLIIFSQSAHGSLDMHVSLCQELNCSSLLWSTNWIVSCFFISQLNWWINLLDTPVEVIKTWCECGFLSCLCQWPQRCQKYSHLLPK